MRASHPRWLRYVAPFALGVLGLAACETYLTDPVEGDAGDPPILVDVRLEPSSVDVSIDEALATAAIGARASGGLSGVSVVLRSPSGAERLECGAEPPTTGTVFDGEWRCDLAISPTAEAGLWRPDSVALRPIGAPPRWFTGAQLASLGVEPALAVTFAPGEPTSLRIEVDTLVLRTVAPRTLGVRVEDAFDARSPAPRSHGHRATPRRCPSRRMAWFAPSASDEGWSSPVSVRSPTRW
jgi:hypothetical protein